MTNITLDPHNLWRFWKEQYHGGTYHQALAEIRAGRKVGHWIWYVFPRLVGDGYSEVSEYFALADREEAAAYLRHPVLGPRLVECCRAAVTSGRTLLDIFGATDAAKVRQCAELFGSLAGADPVFAQV